MDDATVLGHVLREAVKRGYVLDNAAIRLYAQRDPVTVFVEAFDKIEDETERENVQRALLLSHPFAKAFFGEEWEKNLQQAVLQPLTLAYYVNLVSHE